MFAGGNVVVISDSSKVELKTPFLEWKNAEKKLYSTERVEISSPKEKIFGYGFESDLKLSNYKIFKVSGTSEIDNEKK